jgi:hypothetical protein
MSRSATPPTPSEYETVKIGDSECDELSESTEISTNRHENEHETARKKKRIHKVYA